MQELAMATLILLAGVALFGIAWMLERAVRRPGLSFLILGVLLLVGVVIGPGWWQRLLFGLQALGFFYLARWRHTSSRASRAASSDA